MLSRVIWAWRTLHVFASKIRKHAISSWLHEEQLGSSFMNLQTRMGLSVLTILSVTLHAVAGSAQEKDDLRLRLEHLECVQQHADEYKRQNAEKILIVLSLCPITDLTAIISEASSANLFYRQPSTSQDAVDNVLRLTASELDCLVERVPNANFDPVVIANGNFCDE